MTQAASSLFFEDRIDAGKQLAKEVQKLVGPTPAADLLVLGLPRGGVVCANEVAKNLKAPLDILLVRKLGAPFNEELAVGALVEGSPPEAIYNQDLIRVLKLDSAYLDREKQTQSQEMERRKDVFRKGRARKSSAGKTVILVDDGIATGASVRAALICLKKDQVKRLILAVPVAPPDFVHEVKTHREVDDLICLYSPPDFRAVGQFYRDFRQVSDDQVVQILSSFS